MPNNFSLKHLLIAEPSAERQVNLVATIASILTRVAIVPSTRLESDEKATNETENSINQCKTRSATLCLKSKKWSLKTSSLHDPMLEVRIVAAPFATSTLHQNPKPRSALSCLKKNLAIATSGCSFFHCFFSLVSAIYQA